MGKVVAVVFTAVVAPIVVFLATQKLKQEDAPEPKAAKAAGKKAADETAGGAGGKPAPEPSRVVAEGAGPTPEAATEDAHRSAVRQVLPRVVEAGELARKGPVIEAQVLKDPDPFVRRSEVVEASRDKGKGRDVHRCRLQVTVDRRALAGRLEAVGVRVEARD